MIRNGISALIPLSYKNACNVCVSVLLLILLARDERIHGEKINNPLFRHYSAAEFKRTS